MLIVGRALGFYVGKLLWPAGQMAIYPKWDLNPAAALQWLWVVGAIAVAFAFLLTRRTLGRAPAATALMFFVIIAPVLGFAEYNYFGSSYVADHLAYHASICFVALVVAAASWAWSKTRLSWAARVPACAAVIIALGIPTWRHATLFKDAETLFSHNLRLNPARVQSPPLPWVRLGGKGRLPGPQPTTTRGQSKSNRAMPRSHGALASALVRLGRRDEALAEYRTAISLDPDDPFALNDYANLLADGKDYDGALALYEQATSKRPGQPDILFNLAACLDERGRTSEALQRYRDCLRSGGPPVRLRLRIAVSLAKLGRTDEAVAEFSQVVRDEPGNADARYNLAKTLAIQGDLSRAVGEYREVLRRRPDHPQTLNNLAWLLATAPDAQIRDGREALRLATLANAMAGGTNPGVLDTLAVACAETGAFDEATSAARRALDITDRQREPNLARGLAERLSLFEARRSYKTGAR